MTRKSASGTVLLTLGLMVVALGVTPSNACAQFGDFYFPNDLLGGPNGDFLIPDGFGGGYDYGGPFDGGLTWSPWGDDEEEDLDGEALFDMYMGYGPWGDADDPDAYDGGDEDDDDDDPWDGDPDYDGPRDDWEKVLYPLP